MLWITGNKPNTWSGTSVAPFKFNLCFLLLDIFVSYGRLFLEYNFQLFIDYLLIPKLDYLDQIQLFLTLLKIYTHIEKFTYYNYTATYIFRNLAYPCNQHPG